MKTTRSPFRTASGGSLIALGTATLLAAVLIGFGSADPGAALGAFFRGPWSSPWFLGNTVDAAVLLLTAALGVALAFRGGTFNLGGEGQIYLGGLAAAVVLLYVPEKPVPALLLAALAALAAGGAMGAVSGWLKRVVGADELITSFLLSAALSPVADYLISGPLRDPSGSLLALPRPAAAYLLPRLLPPSSLNVSLFAALALALAVHTFLARSAPGYRFRIAGAGPDFARYAGIPPERYWGPALAASGAIHGLAGFFAVAGTYGVCHRGFSGGLGWNALAVALIGRNKPLVLIPAALAYGWLRSGADTAVLATGLDIDTSALIQAVVLALATVRYLRWSRA